MTENLTITTKPPKEEREDMFHLAYSSVVDFPLPLIKQNIYVQQLKEFLVKVVQSVFVKSQRYEVTGKGKGMVLAVRNYGSHHEDVQGSGDITPCKLNLGT